MKKIYVIMVAYKVDRDGITKGSRFPETSFTSKKKAEAFIDYWNKLYKGDVIHYIIELTITKTDYSKFSLIPY